MAKVRRDLVSIYRKGNAHECLFPIDVNRIYRGKKMMAPPEALRNQAEGVPPPAEEAR